MANFDERKIKDPKNGELSDDELNKVTAGTGISYEVSEAFMGTVKLHCPHCGRETSFVITMSEAKYCTVCNKAYEEPVIEAPFISEEAQQGKTKGETTMTNFIPEKDKKAKPPIEQPNTKASALSDDELGGVSGGAVQLRPGRDDESDDSPDDEPEGTGTH